MLLSPESEQRPTILLLEDSDIDAELICIHLDRSGLKYELIRVVKRAEFEQALAAPVDLVLADYSLPDFSGLEALTMARASRPGLPFVFVSGVGGEELATDALRRGATDYVLKRNLTRLVGSLRRALAEAREREQRERAEIALFRSEARMRLAVDAAGLGLWQYSQDRASFSWDERCGQMLDAASAEMAYETLLARVFPPDREALDSALQSTLQDHATEALVHEYRVVDADGAIRWLVMRGQRLSPNPGEGARLTGVLQDISATRRLEARQRQSEVMFRIAAQATRLGIWEFGPGPEDVWIDQSYREMASLPPDSTPGYSDLLRDVVHPEDRERLARVVHEAMTSNSGDAELEVAHRVIGLADRVVRWLELKGRRITGIDGRARLVGTVRDVTEQRALQQALRNANQELERRVAERTRELTAEIAERGKVEDTLRQMQRLEAVGQLTSGVAHDFNNLLSVVLSNVTLVERLLAQAGVRDARVVDRLGSMRNAANRGATLTRQLLAFSRRQRLEPQTVDFNEIVTGIRDLLQTTLGGSVNLQTELATDLWPARVDPTQIEMVILNLAINARDAMEVGGSLKVQTANRTLTALPSRPGEPEPGDYVALSVIDTGSGMPAEVLAKAFEPFFTTKQIGKGSGLGLAQVYGFAQQSGGGVHIDTRLGVGTAVHVYLPRAAADAADAPPAKALDIAHHPRRGAARTVLLVDDDDAVREATAALLAMHGFEISEASDGPGAIAQAQAKPDIDAVIADFAMPRMNGAELARQLREIRPGLPLLFLTGFAELGALDDIPEDFVLQKPIAEADLVARLNRLLP